MTRSAEWHPFGRLLAMAFAGAAMAGPAPAGVTVLESIPSGGAQSPTGIVLLGADGRLYGTSASGGAGGAGTVWAVGPAGSGQPFTILHALLPAEGQQADVGLAQRADGTLFGSAPSGSASGGSLFSLDSDGSAFQVLDLLDAGTTSPHQPGQLLDGGDGFLYGTMRLGGASEGGTLFRMTPGGAVITLFSFTVATGAAPDRVLTTGPDGRLYGALHTGPGGLPGGAIFSIARDGSDYRVLHTLTGNDGVFPSGALTALGGDWYGVTAHGGAAGGGVVFRLSSLGVYSVLHAFAGGDGGTPLGPLAAGPDGQLYGLTAAGGLDYGDGGSAGYGTIFRLTTAGAFLTLHRLTGSEGTAPASGPVMDAAGTLYGATTSFGGGWGSVFQFDALQPQPPAISMGKYCENEVGKCLGKWIDTTVNSPYDVFWSSENLGRCTGSGAWSGPKPTGGVLRVIPRRPGWFNYRLACTGPHGNASSSITVRVL